jgi:Divergent InlB B-repeat domain
VPVRLRRALIALTGLVLLAAGSASGASTFTWRGLASTGPTFQASTAAVAWCGSGESSTNRPDAADVALSSPNLVHVSYVIPADGADRFASVAPAIVSDLAAVDAWWRGQDPLRTPRFDLIDVACSSRIGRLDLGFVRLPNPASSYMGSDRGQRLTNDLAALAPPAVKNIVYYDGPPPADSDLCGFTGFRAPGEGGAAGFAFVLVQGACPADLGTGGIMATAAVHELTHNLGAVVPGAPHACAGDGAHVCDSDRDLMWPYATPAGQLGNKTLDVGHDDYYGHAGSWFDVQDSAWLVHLPQLPLAVSTVGTGTVRIAGPGGSAECGAACSTELDGGTTLTLTAEPGPRQRLVAWQGSCSGRSLACSLTMDAAKTARAVFGASSFTARVTVRGKGKVTSSPAGIACPSRCRATFTRSVTLRPRPARGYSFAGWAGACTGRAACRLTFGHAGTVRASFRRTS